MLPDHASKVMVDSVLKGTLGTVQVSEFACVSTVGSAKVPAPPSPICRLAEPGLKSKPAGSVTLTVAVPFPWPIPCSVKPALMCSSGRLVSNTESSRGESVSHGTSALRISSPITSPTVSVVFTGLPSARRILRRSRMVAVDVIPPSAAAWPSVWLVKQATPALVRGWSRVTAGS